jgi:hypothetical protein
MGLTQRRKARKEKNVRLIFIIFARVFFRVFARENK